MAVAIGRERRSLDRQEEREGREGIGMSNQSEDCRKGEERGEERREEEEKKGRGSACVWDY